MQGSMKTVVPRNRNPRIHSSPPRYIQGAELLKQAVELINRKYETEASGGIVLENIKAYAETGVDFISVGALTHSVKSLDLSLKAI